MKTNLPAPFYRSPLCWSLGVATASALLLGGTARASTAYGTINNFDCVNDTGVECHGFEIEIEDIQSADVTYTYNWNHYGTPRIIEDNANPLHPKVRIRYESARSAGGAWAAYTAIPSGPIAPTDGHQFTDPNVNFGGEHFGAGFRGAPTNVTYHWLIDDGTGTLTRGPAVLVSTPTFAYFPPVAGAAAQVQAVIQPAPAPEVHPLEFGIASWVKEIRTTSHNNNEVRLRDLVSDDPDDPDERNWRNGEPDEVEVEWQLLQEEFNKQAGGANGRLEGAPEELPGGDEVVTRRYEFYKYVGPLDDETGEAMADGVGPDGIHGVGIKQINGVDIDLSTVVIVGEYLGSQMSAFDIHAPVGLIEHVQDGVLDDPYPTRTIVIGGAFPFTATNWGVLPAGLTFNRVSGELSGTPTEAGVFSFTVEAKAGDDPMVRRTFTLTVVEAGVELPARSTVDTVASPLDRGVTAGDGTYTNGALATVSAVANPGFAFHSWSEQGRIVSRSASYTFTNIVNRSLVAAFVPEPPRLSCFALQTGALGLSWPTNASGFVLQHNSDLEPATWVNTTNIPTVVGTNKQVTLFPMTGSGFFRLTRP